MLWSRPVHRLRCVCMKKRFKLAFVPMVSITATPQADFGALRGTFLEAISATNESP